MSLREEYLARALSEPDERSAGERLLLARAFSNHRLRPRSGAHAQRARRPQARRRPGAGLVWDRPLRRRTGPPHATGGGAMPVATKTMHRSRLNAADLETCVRPRRGELHCLAAHRERRQDARRPVARRARGALVTVMELRGCAAACRRPRPPCATAGAHEDAVALAVARGLATSHGQPPRRVIHRDLKRRQRGLLLARRPTRSSATSRALLALGGRELPADDVEQRGERRARRRPSELAHELYDHDGRRWSYDACSVMSRVGRRAAGAADQRAGRPTADQARRPGRSPWAAIIAFAPATRPSGSQRREHHRRRPRRAARSACTAENLAAECPPCVS